MTIAEPDPADRDLESLSRLLDGDLDEQSRRALEDRLAVDPELRRMLDLLRLAADAAGAPVPSPDADVVDAQVRLAVRALQGSDPPPVVHLPGRHRPRNRILALSAAAILLLAGLVVRGALPESRPTEPVAAERGVVSEVALATKSAAPPSFDDVDALLAQLRTSSTIERAATTSTTGPAERATTTGPAASPSAAADTRAAGAASPTASDNRFDPDCGSDLPETAIVAGRTVRWGVRPDRTTGGRRLAVVDPATCALIADQPW
jgi:hypothetical protein